MTEAQYNQYLHVQTFAKKWQNYMPGADELKREVFIKQMQLDKFVVSEFTDGKSGRKVYIYLMDKESKHVNSSQEMRRLLVKHKLCHIIIISESNFSNHIHKVFYAAKNEQLLDIRCYKTETFTMIMPEAPLAAKHRIMSNAEKDQLINRDLITTIANLPKIMDDDPQCIWIGARTGDIVEITSPSYITQIRVSYGVVIPRQGRIITPKKTVPIIVNDSDDIDDIDEADETKIDTTDAPETDVNEFNDENLNDDADADDE
jgi:DNA-directed RNA polymerase subunit H (RpoH/RPB5)